MEDKNSIIDLVAIDNIDCKKIMFKGGTPTYTDGTTTYFDAELVIVKNDAGRKVFNSLVARFHWHDNMTPLEDIRAYPFYAVTFDMFSSGYHYGKWRYYEDISKLAEDFDIDSMENDFFRFKRDMEFVIKSSP